MALLSMRRGGQSHFYHYDGLGSTVQLSDATQVVTDTYLYDSWGNQLNAVQPTTNPFQYVARRNYYADAQTAKVLIGARYYNTGIGRFISRDRARDGLNWFIYAYGSPSNRVDPSGNSPCKDAVFAGIRTRGMSVGSYDTGRRQLPLGPQRVTGLHPQTNRPIFGGKEAYEVTIDLSKVKVSNPAKCCNVKRCNSSAIIYKGAEDAEFYPSRDGFGQQFLNDGPSARITIDCTISRSEVLIYDSPRVLSSRSNWPVYMVVAYGIIVWSKDELEPPCALANFISEPYYIALAVDTAWGLTDDLNSVSYQVQKWMSDNPGKGQNATNNTRPVVPTCP